MRMSIFLVLTLLYLAPPGTVVSREIVYKNRQGDSFSHFENDSLFSFLPEGTIIHKRTKDKVYCFLPRNTIIQGILCRGDKHRGWETVFYVNGKLALAWLAKSENIQGVPCASASFWTELFGGTTAVSFYPDGQLEKCKLARDVTIDGHALKKGDHIRFTPNGKLMLEK